MSTPTTSKNGSPVAHQDASSASVKDESVKKGIADRLVARFHRHYILVMMLATRLSGSIGGVLVVYYVNLTLMMPDVIRSHFQNLAVIVVGIAVALTILLALWETKTLRAVLGQLALGQPIAPAQAAQAGREAVIFPGRHHRNEAWLVPSTTLLPVLLFLKLVDDAPLPVLTNITLAVFMGIAMALMSTFFVIERCMQPVVRHLLDHGVAIEFETLPQSKLRSRLNLCFGLIILTTALMIGTLARQRAADLIAHPENQAEAVANLQAHTTYISVAAVILGIVFATVLARSLATRVGKMLQAMRQVEKGNLTERVQPTGNDEIDILARQFNAMVEQLDQNNRVIRDLNANLELKVRHRTRQLSRSRRKVQQSLRKLQEHDRLKTQFFSNVSHELRTPLTMILSPVEQALEKHGSQMPAEVSYMLDVVGINGRRLLELINRLLEFSKLEAGRVKLTRAAVNINHLVGKLASAAKPLTTQRRVDLRVTLDPALPVLGADEEKMDTVISNLLSNAIKFTPPGGVIEVETALEGERIRVSVRDTGIGIAPADQARIFERFVQIDGSASREFPGTGLGLSLAKELVEMHGGEIQVESESGKGSHFWFHLPVVAPPELAAPASGSSADDSGVLRPRFSDLITCETAPPEQEVATPAPADAPTVLVVDDTPELRSLVRTILSPQYQTLLACDGQEGIEAAERELPALIISDVMMPRIDGYEFCRRIKSNPATAHIPFIMLTAKAERSMKIEGLDCGADDYLVKPFDADELRARVRSLLKLRRLHLELDLRNGELEKAVKELQTTQARLVDMAHRAGMTEIATGVLHNVGNVLNSVNISVTTLNTQLQNLKLEGPAKAAALLQENAHDLARFLQSDSRGKKLPDYLSKLSGALLSEQKRMFGELEFLREKLQDIRNIISAQQNYARKIPFREPVDLEALVADVLVMHSQSFAKHDINVVREFEPVPVARLERLKLVQVLDNLVKNAVEAMKVQDSSPRTLTVGIKQVQPDRARVVVSDTGRGIDRENLQKIFNYGFTTKRFGNGFGLHSAANAMAEMGGTIQVNSDGLGKGATFTIEFTLQDDMEEGDHAPSEREKEPVCA
jgi:two-component system sensor histidine kinase ChiS